MEVRRLLARTLTLALLASAAGVTSLSAIAATATPAAGQTAPAPAPPGSPRGAVDDISRVPGGIHIRGWAIDPDTTSAISVDVYAGTVGIGRVLASVPRNDVGAANPGFGEAHGFDATLAVNPGDYQLCVYALNVGPGGNRTLGCEAIVVDASPGGAVDAVFRAPGGLRVTGWAIDRDTSSPIDVHVHDNGAPVAVATADRSRPDVAVAAPGYGDRHGFDVQIGAGPGAHRICVFAINVGAGPPNQLLGCSTITVTSLPDGSLEPIGIRPDGFRVTGWARDPDTAAPVTIHVYLDGRPVATRSADVARPGVVTPFPGYGDAHFFEVAVDAAPGRHTVCVYAIDTHDAGRNTLLGCPQVDIGRSPVGIVDSITRGAGGLRVVGWALDPDSVIPLHVHAYAGTTHLATFVADQARADIGAAFPSYGPNHGFDGVLSVPPGVPRVCFYAIDVGGQPNSLIGCGRISDDTGLRGALDAVVPAADGVRVAGWALDLDVADPVNVHVYANGGFVGAVNANTSRPDIGSIYTGFGDHHGFDFTFALAPGNYQVCVYAINAGVGAGNLTLGCRGVSRT